MSNEHTLIFDCDLAVTNDPADSSKPIDEILRDSQNVTILGDAIANGYVSNLRGDDPTTDEQEEAEKRELDERYKRINDIKRRRKEHVEEVRRQRNATRRNLFA